jgi:MFS transporter, putative metabolite:H+ symporter
VSEADTIRAAAPLFPAGARDPAAIAAELTGRLESVPFTRWHVWPRVIMGSAIFFDAFSALALASAMPVLRNLWHLTPGEIGLILATSYFGQLPGALLFGWLGERIGRVRATTYTTAIMAAGSLACALTGNFTQMFVCRLLQGIGIGGAMPVAASYVNEISRAEGRGRFFMLYETIFPVGFVVVGFLGAFLVPRLGWNALFLLGFVPGLVIMVLVMRLPESPRWLIRRSRFEEAENVIREIEASTLERHLVAVNPENIASQIRTSRWSELFSPAYRSRTLIVWTIWATAYGVTNGVVNWAPTLYNAVYHLPLQVALSAAPLGNVTQVLVLAACIFLIDRIGRRTWMTACFVFGGALLAILGLVGAQNVTAVIVLVTASYGVMSTINTVLYLYTPEIYPTRMRAIGTAAGTCWLRLASAAGPFVVGRMMETTRIAAIFLLFAGISLLGALAAAHAIETRNRRLEDIAP